ncbi:MAG: aspartate kinase [Pseudomonadota bacterium]
MARIVMKFGGTSVANLDRIRNAALRIKQEYDAGNHISVVVSAMAGVTNDLVEKTTKAAKIADLREYDTIVTSGEQVTAGLMAIVLQDMGIPARSWLGWQIPIETDDTPKAARIQSIDPAGLIARMEENIVCVCAGFQGVSPKGRITSLGRSGSDTTAVALAAALNAERCDIYTDVDGIFTTDPRIVPKARKLDIVSHEEMLELASVGAKVLHVRSVELAMNHNVRVHVLNSFDNKPGTMLVPEEEIVESHSVTGIALERNEAKVSVIGVPDKPGIAASIFVPIGALGINVDMIVQSISPDGMATDMTFTVARTDMERTMKCLQDHRESIGYQNLHADDAVAKVSVVGTGMRSNAGVAQDTFRTLAEGGINLQVISTSEIKISVLISENYGELAVRLLHEAFGLEEDPVQ